MSLYPPLISVIIPAYNAEAFIGETLVSVLAQTHSNIEVLVVDDGSQDRTAELVKSIALRDRRITLLQQSNKGVAAARNLAIEKSSGEYVAPIDADDIWYPQKLEKQLQCLLQAEPSVGLVYGWSVHINKEGLLTGKYITSNLEGDVYVALVYSNFVGHASAPLIRRTCFEQVGGYSDQLEKQNAQGLEDWDLYLRIAERYQFQVVPEFLIGYRQLVGSMSCNYESMEKSFHLIMANVRQQHPAIPATVHRSSKCNYYCYLAAKSNQCGSYWRALLFLYKALRSDTAAFINTRLYKMFINTLLKLTARQVFSLFRQDYSSWLTSIQQLKLRNQVIEISSIEGQISKPQRP